MVIAQKPLMLQRATTTFWIRVEMIKIGYREDKIYIYNTFWSNLDKAKNEFCRKDIEI